MIDRLTETAEQTIARLHAGDESAYESLWQDNHARLLAVAYRVLRDAHEAEDVVQEAFTTLVRKLGSFRGEAAISTWLHIVALNAARMRLRKRKRTPRTTGETRSFESIAAADQESCPVARMGRSDAIAQVHLHIEGLENTHREVLRLRTLEQLDTDETAARLRISVGAVKARYFRACAALGRSLRGTDAQWDQRDATVSA